MTLASLWNYCRDEIDDVNQKASDGKSFKCKTKTAGKTPERPERPQQPPKDSNRIQPPQLPKPPVPALNAKVTIPYKYLCMFWICLDLSLIKCETELNLSCTKDCIDRRS